MEIDEHPVPDAVVAAFCRLVDCIDAKEILATSSLITPLFQGYRVIQQNVPVARQRLKAALKNDRHLDSYTATLLRDAGLGTEVVAVLSEAALQDSFSDLVVYFGEAHFLGATLLDEREAVRKLAHDFIAGWDGQAADDVQRERAAEGIRSAFASFITNIKALQGETLPYVSRFEKGQEQAAKGRPDKTLDAVKADITRISKKADAERKELRDKIDQKQKEIDGLRSELVFARTESKTREAAFAEVKKDLTQFQASLERHIDEGVGKALSGRLRQWLEPVRNVEDAIAGARQSELLGRAADALERQRSVDLNYGNRTTLARMIEGRRNLLANVQSARVDALNPLPELRGIADELEREIGDLTHRLGLPAEQIATAASGLLARINEAQSLDELSDVRQFIQQAAAYDLLNRKELHRIYRALDDKAGLLYDKAEVFGEVRASSPKTRFFLRRAVAIGESFTLFIDGHNVLFELKDIFGQYFVDDLPGTKARVEFASRLTRIFDKPGADVLLYFDGSDPKQHSLSGQVRVIYSGGTGEHRADEAILKHLMAFKQSVSSTPLCLVTRDADFARQARKMGVIIMHPEEFAESVDLAAA